MSISADKVKEVRNKTNISVIECKKALEEADGDVDKAIDILDKKSGKAAAKKADRDLGSGAIATYVHGYDVGAMVELQCETDFVARNEEFQDLAYEIAMHIAAMNPRYLSEEDVPEEEKESLKEDFADELEGKPEDVQKKITEGKLSKYYEKHVLLHQPYIKDDEKSIQDLIEEGVQKFGENISIGQFERFETLDR